MVKISVILCLCAILAGISVVLGQLPCKDRSTFCKSYEKHKDDYCYKRYSRFMRKNCQNFCGFCNCKNWRYGCCKDRKTRADGPHGAGCAQKLCYDVKPNTCQDMKKNGTCEDKLAKALCPWSCGRCKSPAPMKSCLHNIGYGCCWDGSAALGPNGKGCRPCVDTWSHICGQFLVKPCTNTGAYYKRTFLLTYCPKTCGYCPKPKCRDRSRRCGSFLMRGYCDKSVWKAYLAEHCAKTCEFCKDKNEGILP